MCPVSVGVVSAPQPRPPGAETPHCLSRGAGLPTPAPFPPSAGFMLREKGSIVGRGNQGVHCYHQRAGIEFHVSNLAVWLTDPVKQRHVESPAYSRAARCRLHARAREEALCTLASGDWTREPVHLVISYERATWLTNSREVSAAACKTNASIRVNEIAYTTTRITD